jgi:hypothetical protein
MIVLVLIFYLMLINKLLFITFTLSLIFNYLWKRKLLVLGWLMPKIGIQL